MVRRRSLRAARAGATVILAAVLVALVPAGGTAHADDADLDHAGTAAAGPGAQDARAGSATSRRAARRAAERTTPLQVTIETLTPSTVPQHGKIRLAGTVTNADTVPWLTVNVYSFISAEPMTSRSELAAAVQVEETQSVGERITDLGNFDTID